MLPREFISCCHVRTPALAIFWDAFENASIPKLVDYTGAEGAPGERVGLQVARASSLWHSAAVSSRVNLIHEDPQAVMTSYHPSDMMTLSLRKSNLVYRLVSDFWCLSVPISAVIPPSSSVTSLLFHVFTAEEASLQDFWFIP